MDKLINKSVSKKLDSYKNKLLDTGLGNKLINYQHKVSSFLEIVCDDTEKVIDDLVDGKKFEFAELFFDSNKEFESVVEALGSPIEKKKVYDVEEINSIKKKFCGKKNKNYLFSTSITFLQNKALETLRKKAILFQDECGMNTLFLAYGFLKWKTFDKTELISPLCLIPITITKKQNTNYISITDDGNPICNDSLIHKLKVENNISISFIDDEEQAIDYIKRIKKEIVQTEFKYIDKLVIGSFIPSQMKMYQDIESNSFAYHNNKFIQALSGLKVDINENINEDVKLFDSRSTLQVMPSDETQQNAINRAKNGLSFIIQGPPGTGKSQTITNMIGELIGQNKSVLFVCEKEAALNVVYQNMIKGGLKDFCLPLYSKNISKKGIVEEIYQNIENKSQGYKKLSSKANWIYDSMDSIEKKNSNYIRKMDEINSVFNLSNYEIFSEYVKLSNIPDIDYNEDIKTLTREELEIKKNDLFNFSNSIAKLKSPLSINEFYGFKKDWLSLAEKNSFLKLINSFFEHIYKLNKSLVLNICDNIKVDSVNRYFAIKEVIKDLNALPILPVTYFDYENNEEALDSINKLVEKRTSISKLEDSLYSKYDKRILEVNLLSIRETLQKETGLFKGFHKNYRNVKDTLEDILYHKKSLSQGEMIRDVELAITLSKKLTEYRYEEVIIKSKFNYFYDSESRDFSVIKKIINFLMIFEKNKQVLESMTEDYNLMLSNFTDKLYVNDLYKAINSIDSEMLKIMDYCNKIQLYFNSEIIDFKDINFNELGLKLKIYSTAFDSLQNYMDYLKASELMEEKYPNLIASFDGIEPKYIYDVYYKSLLSKQIDYIISSSEEFVDFSKEKQNEILKTYCDDYLKSLEFSKVQIYEEASRTWPTLGDINAENNEVRVLLSEHSKSRKLMPLRVLFSKIPNLLKDVKPCILMSPLNVCMYLDQSKFCFDTVIFDESSQLTSQEAISSIVRAKQVIVVGDDKQLPPSAYFMQSACDDEDIEYDVFSSFFDECHPILPSVSLLNHYRSKNESLIQFSNDYFYHDLSTFKESEPKKDGTGIRHLYVPNVRHSKSEGASSNKEEANKVVDLIFENIDKFPNQSLGVVAFNMAQQELISSILEKRRKLSKKYDGFFDEEKKDKFFIKNLETVQGDERDTIILSIGFCLDENGKLSYNFGPISKLGGEKRINVAVSRSKYQIIVVHSILPEDFNRPTQDNRGADILKKYLAFVIKNENHDLVSIPSKDGIVNDIVKRLETKGLKCHTNVGISKNKIDIAVLNPVDSNCYLIAIIVDGLSYKSKINSRERDFLFDNVLQSRGWRIYHIWSPTYIYNPADDINNLYNLAYKKDDFECVDVDNSNTVVDNSFVEDTKDIVIGFKDLFEVFPNAILQAEHIKKDNQFTSVSGKIYMLLSKVGPIEINSFKKACLTFLEKKVLSLEISSDLDNYITEFVVDKKAYSTIGFIMTSEQLMNARFRRNDESDNNQRQIDEIYIEELACGFYNVLENIKSADIDTLYSIMNDLLGYTKLSERIRNCYSNALTFLVDNGKIIFDNDIYRLT